MRKVTASAVILTALTGCSQSSIPSTQWSFEVPTDDQASDTTETALASDRSLSVMSEEARSFIEQPTGGRVMGPAFEQPATEASERASVSTAGRPGSKEGNKEVSTLAAEAYGVTSGLATQRSTRPDPVAQVRAYLRSSGSPSALTNRTPYNSGVYLSSLPTPNRYYEPSVSSLNTAFPIGTADLGLTDTLPAPFSASVPTISSAISNSGFSSTSSELISNDLTFRAAAPAAVATFTATEPAVVALTATESTGIDSAIRLNSQLPQLEAGLPEAEITSYADSDIDRLPQLSQRETVSTTSIGTSILQDLQRQDLQRQGLQGQDSVRVAVQSEDDGLPRLVSDRSVLESDQAQSFSYEAEPVSATDAFYYSSTTEDTSVNSSASSTVADLTVADSTVTDLTVADLTVADSTVTDLTVADLTVADSMSSERPENDYAYAPTGEAQPVPSLSRLTETMPARDVSPLVNSFRSSNNSLPTSESSFLGDAPASEADFETVSSVDLEAVRNTNPAAIAIPTAKPALIEPTIYVPIAEDPKRTSSILLQDAADTLNSEVSTADFISDLVAQDTFSSILTSSAFMADDDALIMLTNLRPQSDEKRTKQSHLKSAHRSAAVALAAKQISMRRQRLTWM